MDSTMTLRAPRDNSPLARSCIDGIEHKQCRRCKTFKPLALFYKGRGFCKPCHRVEGDLWRAAHPEQAREQARSGQRKRRHGTSREEYAAMVEVADGKCQICGVDPRSTDGRGDYLAVDHDHSTGLIRGILCRPCNLALGYMQDDPDRLVAAARYLEAVMTY